MNAPLLSLDYWPRLLGVCVAAGAAVYAAAAVAALAWTPALLRRTAGLQRRVPVRAAAEALALRLFPLAAALALVGGFCLPSYLFFEPQHGPAEQVGPLFCALVLAGGLLLAWMLAGAARAWLSGWRYARTARRVGERRRLGGLWVHVLAAPAPSMAVSGTWRPLLTVSRAVVEGLSPAQIEAGLHHERAHLAAWDNLKRLLLLATPLPGARARSLERTWARLAEWIADDRAVAGDPARSLTLASTLVAVARLAPSQRCPAMARCSSTLELGPGRELAERVRRLLNNDGTRKPPAVLRPWWLAAAALALAAALQPITLSTVHTLLERLVH